jgi:hypothetical protein
MNERSISKSRIEQLKSKFQQYLKIRITFPQLSRSIRNSGATKATWHTHRLQHSNAAKYNHWNSSKREFYTVERNGRRYALVLSDETHQHERKERVILFGRELLGKRKATGNTARLTFNSSNFDASGFFVRPTLKAAHQSALNFTMGAGTSLPRFVNGHIQLGQSSADRILDYFLIALGQVENVKNTSLSELEQMYPEGETFSVDEIEAIRFDEGELKTASRRVRKRSARLRQLAVAHYTAQSRDGRLHCYIDDWVAPVAIQKQIVQIHHDAALSTLPERGASTTFAEAIKSLFPLCPNCHAILHSNPRGSGDSMIHDLKKLVQTTRHI